MYLLYTSKEVLILRINFVIVIVTRLEMRLFMWDYNKGDDNWSNRISRFNIINCMHVYRNKTWCGIKEI